MTIYEQQQALLQKTLAIVPFAGWTLRALEQAETEAGLPAGTHLALFPDGIEGVLAFWMQQTQRQTEEAFAALSPAPVRVRDRVVAAVWCRLQTAEAHKEAVRAALGYYALPINVAAGARNTWRTVDSLWYLVGDKSTDFNYYTKRGLLAGVYASTLLVWLNDTSEGHADSRAFLLRRIDDVMQIEKAKQTAKAWLPCWPLFR